MVLPRSSHPVLKTTPDAELNELRGQAQGSPRDASAVIFQAKHGPNRPIGDEDIAAWSKARSADALCAWHAIAGLGERIV